MADISRFGIISHLRADPTTHVRHLRNGKLAHDGPGQAFWFRPLNSSLSEIPVDDREQPLLFHGRTVDFQDVTVQATVAYRVVDPGLAATRLDFGIDPVAGRWRSTPLEQLGGLLTELAQQNALDLLARMPLPQALAEGMSAVRERIAAGLRADERISDLGIEVVDVRVVAVRAESDVERALQTPTREQVQADADKATYERRAIAVERERAIAENELKNQIELARREEQLVEQRGQNERRRASEEAAASRINTEAKAERDQLLARADADTQRLLAQVDADTKQLLAQVDADTLRLVGQATADAQQAWLAAYDDVDRGVVLAQVASDLAGSLPSIGTLNLTPDVVTSLLSRLASAPETGTNEAA